jgi:cytochrome c oxidase subunit 3
MNTSVSTENEINPMIKAKRQLMYWAFASILIFFGGLISYYLVMHRNSNWMVFELPNIFLISTAILLVSSFSLSYAQIQAKKNQFTSVKLGILLTFILGLIFVFLQMKGWKEMFSQGIFFAGKSANISGSIVYVITFLHFLHLCGGLLAILFSLFKSMRNKYTADNYHGLSLVSLYWHFMDILWLVLFLFLFFNR